MRGNTPWKETQRWYCWSSMNMDWSRYGEIFHWSLPAYGSGRWWVYRWESRVSYREGIPLLEQPIAGRGVPFRVAAEAVDTDRLILFSRWKRGSGRHHTFRRRIAFRSGFGDCQSVCKRFRQWRNGLVASQSRVNKALTWIANPRLVEDHITDTINGFRALEDRILNLNTTVKRSPDWISDLYPSDAKRLEHYWRSLRSKDSEEESSDIFTCRERSPQSLADRVALCQMVYPLMYSRSRAERETDDR